MQCIGSTRSTFVHSVQHTITACTRYTLHTLNDYRCCTQCTTVDNGVYTDYNGIFPYLRASEPAAP